MTDSSPTPNDMPGASAPNPNPQLAEPVSTIPPPPAPTQQPAQQPPTPNPSTAGQAPPAPSPATGDTPDSVEYWKNRAHDWESKARVKGVTQEALDKARKWDEAEASRRTKEENQALEIQTYQARISELETQTRREKIARETGVLPDFLGGGTEEEMREAAKRALEWRGPQQATEPPRPQTSAVPASTVTSADNIGHSPNGVQQLTREQFVALPPNERMAAVRAGQCTNLGIGVPKTQRRMGNQLELGATVTKQ